MVFSSSLFQRKNIKKTFDAITLKHVKLDQKYAMVISTTAGLWRYIIGDVIEFTSIYPFRIKIVGRTKSFITHLVKN